MRVVAVVLVAVEQVDIGVPVTPKWFVFSRLCLEGGGEEWTAWSRTETSILPGGVLAMGVASSVASRFEPLLVQLQLLLLLP